MKFLIIGGSGFIGTHTLTLARQSGYEAIGTQCRSQRSGLLQFDVAKHRIIDCVAPSFFGGPETVLAIHCAGFGGVDACLIQQTLSRTINVERTKLLMEDLRELGARQVYLSSSYVFDGKCGPYRETDPCAPVNEYGRQKVAIEEFFMDRIDGSLILRLGKVIGDRPEESHLLTDWYALARSHRPISCIQGQVLSVTLVSDVATAVLTACQRKLRGIYHVAGNEPAGRETLARRFLAALGSDSGIELTSHEELGLSEPRPVDTSLDSNRFCSETGMEFTSISSIFGSFIDNVHSDGADAALHSHEETP